MKIYFYDQNHNIQQDFIVKGLPLNYEMVQKKCMEYFGDKDPCIIHTNYISKKILIEIDEMISKNIVRNQYYEVNNNTMIMKFLDIPKNYIFFMINDENITY